MIVSLKWLREYVNADLPVEDLTHRLTMAGLEVEGVTQLDRFLRGVVTARVESVRKHPGADRLSLCRVSDGSAVYDVVCGAPNVREGMVTPLALPGCTLANGITLKKTKIRGEVSYGMLCSRVELGLGEAADGIWDLPAGTPVGVSLAEAVGADDVIIEIGITPNRGDCLSMIGVARELSAICNEPLRYPPCDVVEEGPPIETLSSVTLDDPTGCPRYAARIVQGVVVGPSPDWLRARLEAVGLRSINNIVDVTNFILMELGQPLHAFDFDRLREQRIVVRKASQGERFTTLDGVERTLFDDTLLICDGVGPVAVAGIMGGLDSEITPGTTNVLIESAYFQPLGIRRTGKKIGLRSESSYRFERGIDPNGVLRAVDRAAKLMQEVAGGKIAAGRIDMYPEPMIAPELTFRTERANRFLGLDLSVDDMAQLLRGIEMKVEKTDGNVLRVIPPTFRPDISREVDLSEEVARLAGYDSIPVTYPLAGMAVAELSPHMRLRSETRSRLEASGFFEAINYSFISMESLGKLRFSEEDPRLSPVRVKNPLSEELAVMRTSLLPGLLQTVGRNLGHRNDDLRIFELSKIFLPRAGEVLPDEPHVLTGAVTGTRNPDLLYGGEDAADYTDVKGAVENVLGLFFLQNVDFRRDGVPPFLAPSQSASIFCGNEIVGCVGRLHSEVEGAFDIKRPVFVFELAFDKLFELRRARPLFKSLPKFPPVARDIALIVDEALDVQKPVDFILAGREPLIERVDIFDIYKNPAFGEGKKSVGYRLVYRAADRSLTDEEVNALHGKLVTGMLETFQAESRG